MIHNGDAGTTADVGGRCETPDVMTRHTTFKYCLNPTAEQKGVLARHAGASRFAFNQCLYIVKSALTQHRADPNIDVPWTGFDLVNAFNKWKKTEGAGRIFAVDGNGSVETVVTGLPWRHEVYQQVFEEAAVDCGRALTAWSDSRSGKRGGPAVGFRRFRKKSDTTGSFRIRNRCFNDGATSIRVGDGSHRSVTLPRIGTVRVHDDTRPLRRMLAKGSARVLFATVIWRAGRWWVSLNVEAADLHVSRHHAPRCPTDIGGWVGVDRGLSTFLVAATADGREVARVADAPKALARGLHRQQRLEKSLSRKQKGSRNRHQAAAKLGRHHFHVANVRRHFLHQVSNKLVNTHDRLVLEDLNVSGMLRNRRLAQAISDAGWTEFSRLVRYKQTWRHGQLVIADRWYPSSKTCRQCGLINGGLTLADRMFVCACGHTTDRDLNAATNLALWGQNNHEHHLEPRTPKDGGRATNARRREGAGRHTTCAGETVPKEAGTDDQTAPSS
jgi:putative transposase